MNDGFVAGRYVNGAEGEVPLAGEEKGQEATTKGTMGKEAREQEYE